MALLLLAILAASRLAPLRLLSKRRVAVALLLTLLAIAVGIALAWALPPLAPTDY